MGPTITSPHTNVQACSPSAEDCQTHRLQETSIAIDIFNVHAPQFNRLFGEGSLDLSSCSGEGTCQIQVVLEHQITATDGDGGELILLNLLIEGC